MACLRGPQHQSWNNGAMNQFMAAHLAADGSQNGPVTMGSFTRADPLPTANSMPSQETMPNPPTGTELTGPPDAAGPAGHNGPDGTVT